MNSHIDITQTLVRLYIFLAQSLDRALNATVGQSYPGHELQSHLATARSEVMAVVSVNRVVKEKVGEECNRMSSLIGAFLKGGTGKTAAFDELKSERDVLKIKTAVLQRFAGRLSRRVSCYGYSGKHLGVCCGQPYQVDGPICC